MIPTFNYLRTLPEIEEEIKEAFLRVLHSGHLLLGPETESFETEFAKFIGVNNCIAVTSGTMALYLSLASLKIGPDDEVITVSNTCAPTISAIRLAGAVPVFVDVNENDLMMNTKLVEKKITNKTKCILPVHLWGNCVDIESLLSVADKYSIFIIEDCAQAHGTLYNMQQVGTFGRLGCFSFYPTKNIGAYGDAGAIVTNDDDLAKNVRRMRLYGYDSNGCSIVEGCNARTSELQAAFLRVKLRIFPQWIERRTEIAKNYNKKISNKNILKPNVHK
jgi:dTDP-4-amino-4,6-dideoxygalactose transaminase